MVCCRMFNLSLGELDVFELIELLVLSVCGRVELLLVLGVYGRLNSFCNG